MSSIGANRNTGFIVLVSVWCSRHPKVLSSIVLSNKYWEIVDILYILEGKKVFFTIFSWIWSP